MEVIGVAVIYTPDSVARWPVSLQRGPVRVGCWRGLEDTSSANHARRRARRSTRPEVSHFETLIRLMLRRSPSARGGVMGRRDPMQRHRRIEKTMSMMLGMLMMMPVVFGVGGYALVSRRP